MHFLYQGKFTKEVIMFKKLLVASLIVGSSCGVAFAEHYKVDCYKDETPPCSTYADTAGPYLGLSIGPLVNVAGSSSAFHGYTGNLNVGYGAFVRSAFYLAAEAFVEGIGQFKNYQSASGVSPKQTFVYGIDIIPGYLITDYLLGYLRAGVDRGHFNDTNGGNSNVTGWRIGLGGQTNFYQHWDLRGEYVYNQYNRISAVGKVLSNQFNLGVIYKFN